MSDSTLEPFLKLLRSSYLLDDSRIREIVAAFREMVPRSENAVDDIRAFVDFLVAKTTLTRWQCEKLLAGKYKGFFISDYILRDQIYRDEKVTKYCAIDRRTGHLVTLEIEPPVTQGDIRFKGREKNGTPGITGTRISASPDVEG